MSVFLRHSGQSDLNNRFVTTINTAVDWIIHGIEGFTSAHAQYFTTTDSNVPMPTSISLSEDVSIAEMDANFTKYLISYFHRLLNQSVLRRVWAFIHTHMHTDAEYCHKVDSKQKTFMSFLHTYTTR